MSGSVSRSVAGRGLLQLDAGRRDLGVAHARRRCRGHDHVRHDRGRAPWWRSCRCVARMLKAASADDGGEHGRTTTTLRMVLLIGCSLATSATGSPVRPSSVAIGGVEIDQRLLLAQRGLRGRALRIEHFEQREPPLGVAAPRSPRARSRDFGIVPSRAAARTSRSAPSSVS